MKRRLFSTAVLALGVIVSHADGPTTKPIAAAGNGTPIFSPVSKATVDVSDGTATVKVPAGMVFVPAGKFKFGEGADAREVHLQSYDMAGNAYEWTSTVITATNGAERGQQVNDVRGGSWYSTGCSGTSLCTGEGRSGRSGYHSVGFRIATK